jgi:hypothetical protein
LHDAGQRSKKGKSSSFLKKRTKKLLLLGMRTDRSDRASQQIKVFCFFFSKKKYFLPCFITHPPGAIDGPRR